MRNQHDLLAVAYKRGEDFTQKEEDMIRNKVEKRSIQHYTYTFRGKDRFGHCLLLFDVYLGDSASLYQRFRYFVRKVSTAVALNIGISPVFIIVIGY